MTRKIRVSYTAQQRYEYAKLILNEGYNNKQIMEICGVGATEIMSWKKQ